MNQPIDNVPRPVSFREAVQNAGVHTLKWEDDDGNTHFSAWEDGESTVVDAYNRSSLAELLNAWALAKMVKPVSLVAFGGRRGYRIKTVTDAESRKAKAKLNPNYQEDNGPAVTGVTGNPT